jgi:hypothetical protein
MNARRFEVTLEPRFAASRRIVWGLVADTNRWDRSSGLTPGRYDWRRGRGGIHERVWSS